jgi:hypothetical protein
MAAVLLVTNLANALYATGGVAMPAGFRVVCYLLLTAVVYFWFMKFAEENRVSVPFDMGFFLYLAWWAIVPLYLLKVRGARGLWAILAFVAADLVSYGLSLIVLYAVV